MKDVQCYELFGGITLKKSRILILIDNVSLFHVLFVHPVAVKAVRIYSVAFYDISLILHSAAALFR